MSQPGSARITESPAWKGARKAFLFIERITLPANRSRPKAVMDCREKTEGFSYSRAARVKGKFSLPLKTG
jgi:hypothetical protein